MEKITKEQFRGTALHGRGNSSMFYNEILKLKPDEGLTIYRKEWRVSYSPTRIVNRIAKRYGYKFEQGALPDRSGWRVLRVE